MQKEAIKENILSQARNKAETLLKGTKATCDSEIAAAQNALDIEYAKELAEAKSEAESYFGRRIMLAKLDAGKEELRAKQNAIDSVYLEVKNNLVSLNDSSYCDFIAMLIRKYGENGDVIIISERDNERIRSNWIEDLAFELQLDITLGDEYHGDVGGIILRGKKFDKNLTVSAIVGEIREQTESEIASHLFG